MGSGGISNRPKIDPKWEEILQITQSGYQMAPKTPWINVPHPFLPVLGSPLGPPNRPKINFWRKKGAPRNAFLPVWWQMLWFLNFWWIFGRFLMRFQCKNRCMFLHQLVFFSNWRPSQNIVFYDVKPTFSFFVSIIVFQKNLEN